MYIISNHQMLSFTDYLGKKSALTFQSREVTSLLLGTSCPPSRMQCRRTSCVGPLVLFSLRFHILAVESPDLQSPKIALSSHDNLMHSRIQATHLSSE